MQNKKEFALIKGKIRGGIHPKHYKNTADCETIIMPQKDTVLIPMQQHIGVPCTPTVSVGDTVFVGTKIGECEKYISSPIHSSVSGTVTAIKTATLTNGVVVDAIEIESDGKATPDPELKPHPVNTPEELAAAVREMGLVGLGGAGFPTHVKLTPTPDKPLKTLIINGAECEPYITADYRECMENSKDVIDGIYTLLKILKFEEVIIGIEDNKPKALNVLYEIAASSEDTENRVKLLKLPSHYPQGAEKVLIYSATGKKLPLGRLPADIGCVVMNITSVAAIAKYIRTGMPLVAKRLTVDGDAIKNPCNVLVPLGTPISKVIEFCGGFTKPCKKVVVGGPMMGFSIENTDIPVLKQNNAILCFSDETAAMPPIEPCIRCGKCADACPMGLTPFHIAGALKCDDLEKVEKLGANYCMECGSCAYSCPAKRPIVQAMRTAKTKLRKRG